ncbi:MAG: FAD-dependent monooxygenase [Mycobacterium kyogaense]|uniref:FAD-dependent monooxygenase n=1 Tax=Mycobacterium kyogaense TaxID=2212479 RepID=UPI002FFD4597
MADTAAVVVVGAGPVGLVAAAELARRGVSVRIVDKLAVPTDESRAIAVHARSLDMFARMGVVDALIATGVKARGMALYSGGDLLMRVPLDGVHAAYPFSLNTPQTETERVLTEHLASLGVEVERGVELVALSQDGDGVTVGLRHGDGTDENVTVAWVIGADGAHSAVRHLLGGRLRGSFVGERFLLGDVDAEHDLDPETMFTFFAPQGPVLAMPMRDGRIRVMAQVHDADGAPLNLHPRLEDLQTVVDDRVGGIDLVRAHWLTTFEIHHAQIDQYRWGRVFLAGDAAHIHSPAGGQGMNTGMQDAHNLAWKLAAVIHATAGDGLLDSYHAERHPVAQQVIESSDRLSRGGTVSGAGQHLRNALLKVASHVGPIPRAMADWAAEVNINYRRSPVVIEHSRRSGPVAAGDYFPPLGDSDVAHRLGAAWGVGHAILTIATGDDAPPVSTLRHGRRILLTSDAGGPIRSGYDVSIADPQQHVARRLGLERGGGTVVIRPDGYIGAIATEHAPNVVDDYFATLQR